MLFYWFVFTDICEPPWEPHAGDKRQDISWINKEINHSSKFCLLLRSITYAAFPSAQELGRVSDVHELLLGWLVDFNGKGDRQDNPTLRIKSKFRITIYSKTNPNSIHLEHFMLIQSLKSKVLSVILTERVL